MNQRDKVQSDIYSIKSLLDKQNIVIPIYQRPYRWQKKSVIQLLDDLFYFWKKETKHYRLGTIVFHKDLSKKFNIVDGQQRTITLWLICYELNKKTNARQDFDLFENHQFDDETIKNIQNNYLYIKEYLANKFSQKESDIKHFHDWILDKCEVVTFTLEDLSEAFQFFDSQNSRGKELYPHDLLKAFHLREFDNESKTQKITHVSHWEEQQSSDIADLFSVYLFSIKNWLNQNPTDIMTKDDIQQFKGLNIKELQAYSYTKMHYFIESLRLQMEGSIASFQLDQIIINGSYFFDYTKHYLQKIEQLKKDQTNANTTEGIPSIWLVLHNNKNYRSGDKRVSYLFLSAYIYFIDKFGDKYSNEFIILAFKWTYTARIIYSRISLATINNYVLDKNNNLFLVIKNALKPEHVFKAELNYQQKFNEKKNTHFKNNDERILNIFGLKRENNEKSK